MWEQLFMDFFWLCVRVTVWLGKLIIGGVAALVIYLRQRQPVQITNLLDSIPKSSTSLPPVAMLPSQSSDDGLDDLLGPLPGTVTALEAAAPVPSGEADIRADQGSLLAYTIALPSEAPWDSKRALALIDTLLNQFGALVFQIAADSTSIQWQILDVNERDPHALERAIRASYPDAEISVETQMPVFTGTPFYRYVGLSAQALPFFAPLLSVTDLKDHDPLVAFTQAMNELRAGERLVYTLMIVGFAQGAYEEGRKLITKSAIHPLQFFSSEGIGDAIGRKLSGNDRVNTYIPEQQRVFEDKLNARLYQAAVLLQLDSPKRERIASLALVSSHISGFAHRDFNELVWLQEPLESKTVAVTSITQDIGTDAIGRFFSIHDTAERIGSGKQTMLLRDASRLILEPREVATLWHLPHAAFRASRIRWINARQVQMPEILVGKRDGIQLGTGRSIGRNEPVFLKTVDRRSHMSIVGKTGFGKSTLLHHCIHQDIAAGRGVAVIDPKGTLVRDVLRWSIPEGREGDVVVLDLAQTEYPMPLNLLGIPPGNTRSSVPFSPFLSILDRLYRFEQTRMRDTLAQALTTACMDDQPTLRDVARLLDDPAYRARLIDRLENAATLDFWAQFENQTSAQQEQISYPVVSRLRSFYGIDDLYPVICHPDTLDFGALLKAHKIILLSLATAEARVPEREQHLIGSLVVSALQTAAMSSISDRTDGPYFLFIDEAQHFVTTSLEKMLSEARQYDLSLTLANQFFAQLAGDTLDAVMGNMGTMITFACGPDDARLLAKYMQPSFRTEVLMALDKYQAAVQMQYEGKTVTPFTLATASPVANPAQVGQASEREARIRQLSREHFTPKSRAEVLAWLNEKYPKPKRKPGIRKKASHVSDNGYYDKKTEPPSDTP